MAETVSEEEVAVYVPTEDNINDVSFQLPEIVSRDVIREVLVKTSGDITEAILQILTNDNVIPKNVNPQRNNTHAQIEEWNDFYNKVLDKYNIEHNIDRVKKPIQLDPSETSTSPYISSGNVPGGANNYGSGFESMFNMPSILPGGNSAKPH